MAKEIIIDTYPEINHMDGIERIRKHLRTRATKEQLVAFLRDDTCRDLSHNVLVEKILFNAAEGNGFTWEDVVYGFPFDMEDVRVCDVCGLPMTVGVYANDMHYCSDECLDKGLGIENYLKAYEEDEDSFFLHRMVERRNYAYNHLREV